MAGLQTVLYQTTFSSTASITVTHNLDLPAIGLVVRVVIGNVARPDLVEQVYPTPSDPTNKMEIVLSSSQTGFIQILSSDIIKFASGATFSNTFFYGDAESLGESGTTSTTYVQKLRLTTIVVPAGDYVINWSWEYAHQATTEATKTRIQVDDTTTLAEYAGAPNISYAQGGYYPGGGFAVITLTNAAHNIDVDYASSVSNKTAYIKNVRLSVWKVS